MSYCCNDTPESGWGTHRPGARLTTLAELEIGKFYLRKTHGSDGKFHYNVVEILDMPADFVLVRERRAVYARFVDPRDFSKLRTAATDFYTIWWWAVGERDSYYQLQAPVVA